MHTRQLLICILTDLPAKSCRKLSRRCVTCHETAVAVRCTVLNIGTARRCPASAESHLLRGVCQQHYQQGQVWPLFCRCPHWIGQRGCHQWIAPYHFGQWCAVSGKWYKRH